MDITHPDGVLDAPEAPAREHMARPDFDLLDTTDDPRDWAAQLAKHVQTGQPVDEAVLLDWFKRYSNVTQRLWNERLETALTTTDTEGG